MAVEVVSEGVHGWDPSKLNYLGKVEHAVIVYSKQAEENGHQFIQSIYFLEPRNLYTIAKLLFEKQVNDFETQQIVIYVNMNTSECWEG